MRHLLNKFFFTAAFLHKCTIPIKKYQGALVQIQPAKNSKLLFYNPTFSPRFSRFRVRINHILTFVTVLYFHSYKAFLSQQASKMADVSAQLCCFKTDNPGTKLWRATQVQYKNIIENSDKMPEKERKMPHLGPTPLPDSLRCHIVEVPWRSHSVCKGCTGTLCTGLDCGSWCLGGDLCRPGGGSSPYLPVKADSQISAMLETVSTLLCVLTESVWLISRQTISTKAAGRRGTSWIVIITHSTAAALPPCVYSFLACPNTGVAHGYYYFHVWLTAQKKTGRTN